MVNNLFRAIAVNLNQFVIELYKRKIFFLEGIISKIFSVDPQKLHEMPSDSLLSFSDTMAKKFLISHDLDAAVKVLLELMEGNAKRSSNWKDGIVKVLSNAKPKAFKDWNIELEFQRWKNEIFINMFRFNAVLEIVVFTSIRLWI
ncbi:hypothetical protein HDU97_009925 [Phlyctochytrium planicorne]|nr:hypothetical protein HDU97_009925 [Phlyctochytrium planicorne]